MGSSHVLRAFRIATLLEKTLQVQLECFASPFNVVLNRYCSFFSDIDTYFGSCGNFFHFELKDGSYEINPPFDIFLINKLIIHILCNLKKELYALTFFLVLPLIQSEDYYIDMIFASSYLRHHFLLKADTYTFSSRLFEYREKEYVSKCDCVVFILQNDKAYLKKKIHKKVILNIKKKWQNIKKHV